MADQQAQLPQNIIVEEQQQSGNIPQAPPINGVSCEPTQVEISNASPSALVRTSVYHRFTICTASLAVSHHFS